MHQNYYALQLDKQPHFKLIGSFEGIHDLIDDLPNHFGAELVEVNGIPAVVSQSRLEGWIRLVERSDDGCWFGLSPDPTSDQRVVIFQEGPFESPVHAMRGRQGKPQFDPWVYLPKQTMLNHLKIDSFVI